MKNFVILIPSYKPDEHLLGVVREIKSAGFERFVIVDDGGGEPYAPIFDELSHQDGVEVLTHSKNCGKGAALKTGLSHVYSTYPDATHVLTVDADGQHRAEDVTKLALAAGEHPQKVVLGSRNFKLPNIPFRSRMGNRLTCLIFRMIAGTKLSDTQTGLRSIPVAEIPWMLKIAGDRYEYEMNVLLYLKEFGVRAHEVEIETIYIEENASSHFNPLIDSARIYALIFRFWLHSLWKVLKFSASSLICTAVDILLFYVLHLLFAEQFGVLAEAICQALARVVSSVLNFTLNRTVVFAKRKGNSLKLLLRYYAVSIPQLIVSATVLNGLTVSLSMQSSHWITLLKLGVDLILFLISYRLQRDWVFRKEHSDVEGFEYEK